jgi:hypothetical protein
MFVPPLATGRKAGAFHCEPFVLVIDAVRRSTLRAAIAFLRVGPVASF